MPPMLEYFERGIETAEQRNAEVIILQLNTRRKRGYHAGDHPGDTRQHSAYGCICFTQ